MGRYRRNNYLVFIQMVCALCVVRLKNEEEKRPDFYVHMVLPLSPDDVGHIPLNRKCPMVRKALRENMILQIQTPLCDPGSARHSAKS
jgi:hypothetical protein